MITGVHALFYSSEPEATRAFLRDKLAIPARDVGHGWMIYDLPKADVGVHPSDAEGPVSGSHDVSFFCDDIEATVAEMKERGVEFLEDIQDQGWGLATRLKMPGDITLFLFQAKYPQA